MRPALLLVSLLLLTSSASAQETAPTSHPSGGGRYHRVEVPTPIDPARILAQAVSGDDRITVLADGAVAVTVMTTRHSDVVADPPEPPETRPVHWEARLQASQVKLVREAAATRPDRVLGYDSLLDLARAPAAVRYRVFANTSWNINWTTRHQDPDGSWSPADYDWYCEGPQPCTLLGKESFRVAVTALFVLVSAGAGYPTTGDTAPDLGPRMATKYLLSRQREDGGFAEPSAPAASMTNACTAVALARAVAGTLRNGGAPPVKLQRAATNAIARVRVDQNADGSWGRETDELRRLSVSVWSLLALKAGARMGIEQDAALTKRGLAWIEAAAASIGGRVIAGDSEAARSAHARTVQFARAASAVSRAAAGAEPRDFADDVAWLLESLGSNRVPGPDAEVVLFGTLAAAVCDDALRDAWMRVTKNLVIGTQQADGCAAGTWSTPTIWSDLGGRLVGTAFMTWALEIFYRYPMATWL
jgi:Prenyltransferase and squalene oxidase repeat